MSRFKPFIVLHSIEHQRRLDTRHVIRGRITFRDGSKLDFLEYIVIKDRKVTRISYRCNFRDSRGNLFSDMIMLLIILIFLLFLVISI